MELWLRFVAQWISLAAIGIAVLFYVAPDRYRRKSAATLARAASVVASRLSGR
jgi:hypothetical protein